jgi:hypothetical protein
MHTEPSTQLVEAFLLIEQPRQRLGYWTTALATLDSPLSPPIVSVVAYYDPTCDQALLNLHYDATTLGEGKLQFLVEVALLAEVGMVQPAELSEGARVRFLASRLSRSTIRVTAQRTAIAALTELVRKIRDDRAPQPTAVHVQASMLQPPTAASASATAPTTPPTTTSSRAAKPPPIPATAKARSVSPRGDTADPVMLVTAKGTRDNLEQIAPDALTPQTSRHVVPRAERLATVSMPPAISEQLTAASSYDEDEEERTTSPMDPTSLRALVSAVDAERREADAKRRAATISRRPQRAQSEPYIPTERRSDTIYARYLRGGRWVPVRVGALSLKGTSLLTGALPRHEDRVDIALAFGSHRALVRGVVTKVSNVREASSTGAATFTVSFDLDAPSRKQLTALLLAARDAKITIKPPPARATRRFPVEWQLALRTSKGATKAIALDVSTGGLFVRSAVPLQLDTTVNFSMLLDDGAGAPIAGRAQVVRQITESEARACGLAAGFGLAIVDMPESDRMRWLGFLARIERRVEKRVLVGAEPARLTELQAGLASLGYAVLGGTDPGTLVQLANTDGRPADAVLIDADWLQNDASTSLVESLFSARNVPCVTMQGEVRRARQAIDRLLEVVV